MVSSHQRPVHPLPRKVASVMLQPALRAQSMLPSIHRPLWYKHPYDEIAGFGLGARAASPCYGLPEKTSLALYSIATLEHLLPAIGSLQLGR